jgi:hypothetical protein
MTPNKADSHDIIYQPASTDKPAESGSISTMPQNRRKHVPLARRRRKWCKSCGACIAIEFLDGETLKHRISGKPLPVDETFDLAIDIADGLDAAHREPMRLLPRAGNGEVKLGHGPSRKEGT